jgi:magnesium transporter
MEVIMIRTLCFSQDGRLRIDLKPEEFPDLITDPQNLLWVDFQEHNDTEAETILSGVFGFHPLAIDDALQETHVPKVDDWGKYLYIVLHSVMFNPDQDEHIDTQELDIFLGPNYIVTHHDHSILPVEKVWSYVQRDDRHLKYGVDHLLYRVADEMVASYMPAVEGLDDLIDTLEDEVFDKPSPSTLAMIFSAKRAVLHLRRIIGPQREVMNKLARDDYRVIDSKARVYFRDVYDHLVRLHDITESIRDLVGGTLDSYLSVINNRMNEIMKTLTLITTLFMPLSFITSFFGMNFFVPSAPLTSWVTKQVFMVALLFLVLMPVGMFFWIRRRGWM